MAGGGWTRSCYGKPFPSSRDIQGGSTARGLDQHGTRRNNSLRSIPDPNCRNGVAVMMPSIELLEATHTFPGPYTFKAIGPAEGDFVARVVEAVRIELEIDTDPPHTLRHAAGGRHVSVTLEPTVQSAAQARAVYVRVKAVVGLVMLL